ncbi:hypothetical protein ABZW44_25845 [Streptomyces mirabilis]|uniref:hypothetical protein n=1 Tax=Streptomyces mirabilis TaxID=68239 RepID=UPI00339F84AC
MRLHPAVALEECLARHPEALSLVHGCLVDAVPRALAQWEELYPDAKDIDPRVLAGCIRQCAAASLEKIARDDESRDIVQFEVKDFAGIHFPEWTQDPVRLLKRPCDPCTGKTVSVTVLPEDLFGEQLQVYKYEIALLFTIDYDLKTLAKATLAACSGLDTARSAVIYHEVELPEPRAIGGVAGLQTPAPEAAIDNTGFDDFFVEAEGYGPEPA